MGSYGWDVDCRDTSFSDLAKELHYAGLLIEEIRSENLSEVKRLLEVFKASPNTVVPEHGVAALHLLAGMEDEDFSAVVVLTALLRCHGDPNVPSEDGLTPVHVAAMWGRCRVLELLLSNGGNPYLVDYYDRLNAEDFALRHNQWKAYGIVATFMVISEDEERFAKYLEKEPSATETHLTRTNSCRNTGQEIMPLQNSTETNLGDIEEDWISQTKGVFKLDDNSIKTIKNHRRNTKVYEYPRLHCDTDQTADVKPVPPRRQRRRKAQEESEVYLWRFAESSMKSRSCSGNRDRCSEEDGRRSAPSDRIISKMSRVFLFMLKKRQAHIYEKVK